MADTEQVGAQSPAPFSTWLGVVLLFALFGAIVVAVVGPSPRGDTYEQMRAEARAKKLKDARDGINCCRSGEQNPRARIRDHRAGIFCGTRRGSGRHARAIRLAGGKRDTETHFSCRSKFGSARATRRGRKSAGSAAIEATRRFGVSGSFATIVGRSAGRVTFGNSGTIVNMSILPNE